MSFLKLLGCFGVEDAGSVVMRRVIVYTVGPKSTLVAIAEPLSTTHTSNFENDCSRPIDPRTLLLPLQRELS